MHSVLTCVLMDLVASYLSVYGSVQPIIPKTSCSKQRISNPTFHNNLIYTFINMLRALPSCSHFMTADKLVTASTNWFGTHHQLTPSLLVLFLYIQLPVCLSFRGHSPLVYLPIRAFVFAARIYIQIFLHPLNDPI
ncbi:hypothetical protein NP493_366g02031 [Ridgeia piscesae]|uniref:Secreted protein n=1 Tax=Ridgeia piscesae TaxID=27915 RepID=A0AAD9L2E2_RIDPI|nr:hypothetical protein NP493_366g02031 [Ridgeia piscesae]